MKTKVCPMCKRRLPAERFSKCKAKSDGLGTYCKECHNQYRRDYRKGLTRPKKEQLYALYHGDEILAVGTAAQLAKWQGVNEKTIKWHACPSAMGRSRDGIEVYAISEEEAV